MDVGDTRRLEKGKWIPKSAHQRAADLSQGGCEVVLRSGVGSITECEF